VSDSFATAPRLDSTTLTLRIYPKPPTDHHPHSFVSSSLLSTSASSSLLFLFSATSHPSATAATRALSSYQPQPPSSSSSSSSSSLVVPVSLFLTPPSSPWLGPREREKVTSQSRVSQDPANPSWYKIAPSGSQCHRPRRLARLGRLRYHSDVGKLGLRADRDGVSPRDTDEASERASERERERERSSSLMDIAGLYVALGDLRLMHLVSANPHRPRRKRKDNGSPCSLQLYDRHRRSSRYEPCAPRLIGLLFRPATYHR